MRSPSCFWISDEISQFESRTPHPDNTAGSHCTAFGLFCPKNWLSMAPQISPPEAERSWAPKFPRLQSGTKLWFESVQERLVVITDVVIGLFAAGTSTLVLAT